MIELHKHRWLRDDAADLFVCHEDGGGYGGGYGGGGYGADAAAAAADYAAAVDAALAGRGGEYAAHEGAFGGGDAGSFSGGGLGGDMSAFDAYAAFGVNPYGDYMTDLTSVPTNTNWGLTDWTGHDLFTSVTPVTDWTNTMSGNTSDVGGLLGGGGGFSGGQGGLGAAGGNPGTQGGEGSAADGTGNTSDGGGRGGGGGGVAGGIGGGIGGGVAGGGFAGGSGQGTGGSGDPGLMNQLAQMGWEGFDPYAGRGGINSLTDWRGPGGSYNNLIPFIQAGWAGHRLYTPDFLADTFTDFGTSPQEAYEQLASRGHVPMPIYGGVQDLNTYGGIDASRRPIFPGGAAGGGEQYIGYNPVQEQGSSFEDWSNYRPSGGTPTHEPPPREAAMGALASGPWTVRDLNRYGA